MGRGAATAAVRHAALVGWVSSHYRETLAPRDLGDPALLIETRTALDELTRILNLGSDFYSFQRDSVVAGVTPT